MRKSSVQLVTQTSEPLIVVDESTECRDDEGSSESSSEDSPTSHFQNQFLLSPWRDARETRKLSLPSPQCSGITASQVRRLSERGEVGGPGPRQTEFLATLSQCPEPAPGGRRHSVVTISKVPPAFFGRNRRESVAACQNRVLSSRRESMTGPPSTEPRGSVHNLQLDIMDDIVQSRKVRMKLWNTSNEKVCELKDDNTGTVQKYTGGSNRRYSDFVGTTLAPIPSGSKRRASELPIAAIVGGAGGSPASSSSSSAAAAAAAATEGCHGARKKPPATGIVCSNTDLISILSNLTSSAMEINQQPTPAAAPALVAAANEALTPSLMRPSSSGHISGAASTAGKTEKKGWETRRARLKTNRSNSFDASILHKVDRTAATTAQKTPSDWFVKRHQPMASKTCTSTIGPTMTTSATFVDELEQKKQQKAKTKEKKNKVMWDENSGSVVDAQVLGNAIEDFLRRDSQLSLLSPQQQSPVVVVAGGGGGGKGAVPKKQPPQQQIQAKPKGWFGTTSSNNAAQNGGKQDGDERDAPSATCDSSLCSTLKDLFVK